MTLIKTSFLSLIATVFKISYGFVVNKLLAVYVGPSGVALVGQFQSMQSGLSAIATAGFGQGLIKYLAEYRGDSHKSAVVFATALKLICILLLPVSLGIFLFASELSLILFHSSSYHLWLKGVAVGVIPAAISALLVATLNGLGEIRSLTLVGVFSSCFGIALALIFVPIWGGSGVVMVLLFVPVLAVLLACLYLRKSNVFSWRWLKQGINKTSSQKLGKFTLMALASAIAIPLSHIFIRNYLVDHISLDAAGMWTGMWRISEAYLMVITVTLGVYYLPKLSGLTNQQDLKKEIAYGQKIILPFVLLSAIAMYLCRDWIILLLFNDSFLKMKQLFAFQLLGDVLKIASWLYAYVMLAKAATLVFILSELLFSFMFVLLTIYFVDTYGFVGVSYAFSLNYLFYLFFIVFWFYRSCTKGRFCDETSSRREA